MSSERRLLWAVIAVLAVSLAALLLWPRLERSLAPRPVAAWVAVEVADSGVATVGRIEVGAGTAFTLHAVLEARESRGRTIYYTEAQKLQLGGRVIEGRELRRWQGHLEAKILWFTVEGASPYLPAESEEDLERLRFEEYFRPEWSHGWSIPGSLEPRNDDRLEQETRVHTFGIQRFHARVELYAPDRPLVPVERYKSWGAADVASRVDDFPTIVARLPGVLGPASAVFGLTQLEPSPEASPAVPQRIADLAREGLAFSRLWVLRQVLELAELEPEELSWLWLEIASPDLEWGAQVRPGDLMRVGSRLVFLYRDGGGDNELDGSDLCFDFEQGATVRRLDAVFTGDGVVELASLGMGQEAVGARGPSAAPQSAQTLESGADRLAMRSGVTAGSGSDRSGP